MNLPNYLCIRDGHTYLLNEVFDIKQCSTCLKMVTLYDSELQEMQL